jgi:methylated-DNA-[protein]-cysteine S-methyltransferase
MTVTDAPLYRPASRFVRAAAGPFGVAAVDAPWGPIHVATTRDALIGLSVLSPPDVFTTVVARRTGRDPSTAAVVSPFLDRVVDAVEAFLSAHPLPLAELPLDLGDAGDWDRTVLEGVAAVAWGEVTSYGRVARAIGRPGAARAAGGAIGRNPIGLAIPCHRVIAGDGSIGGYGGDWFGSREELLDIKRELLALEGIRLPVSHIAG